MSGTTDAKSSNSHQDRLLEELSSRSLRQLARLWAAPELLQARLEWSPRLRRSLGRVAIDAKTVRLNPLLKDASVELLREVLCHELAHLVVAWRHGASARPHGPEWRALMEKAGWTPRVRIPWPLAPPRPQRTTFEHRCPVCQRRWRAKRAMRSWRCPDCLSAGLPGTLTVEERPGGPSG